MAGAPASAAAAGGWRRAGPQGVEGGWWLPDTGETAWVGHWAAAEEAVRCMLVRFAARAGLPAAGGTVHAEDRMDDGTCIKLALSIDAAARTAVFDFGGTGPEVWGNTNAPRAVTFSAIIYVLRCLVGVDIPLNQGCLAPVEIRIPPGSILDPAATSAVVGASAVVRKRFWLPPLGGSCLSGACGFRGGGSRKTGIA
jgi:N-methylhydantoinase B/oxoprolinase/acetone carboxylase alpha subunit